MNKCQEFKLCFGVARGRMWDENSFSPWAGFSPSMRKPIEYALYASDPLADREPGRILARQREKRRPRTECEQLMCEVGHVNCRCVVITPFLLGVEPYEKH